jgi:hypothetical protein
MKLMKEILRPHGPHVVRWKKRGMIILDGDAFRRNPGDEDIVDAQRAKMMMHGRDVVVVGPAADVLRRRRGEIEEVQKDGDPLDQ